MHSCTCKDIWVYMHVCEHKNVYLCTKLCMCIFLKWRIYMILAFSFLCFPSAFGNCLCPSLPVVHSSSWAWFHLVPTSLVGSLPSPFFGLDFFLTQLALPSFLICEILSRQSMCFCRTVSMLHFILLPVGKFPGSSSGSQYRHSAFP